MKVGLFLTPVVIFASVQKLLQEESPGSQPFTRSHTLRIPLCSWTHSYVTPTPDVTDRHLQTWTISKSITALSSGGAEPKEMKQSSLPKEGSADIVQKKDQDRMSHEGATLSFIVSGFVGLPAHSVCHNGHLRRITSHKDLSIHLTDSSTMRIRMQVRLSHL